MKLLHRITITLVNTDDYYETARFFADSADGDAAAQGALLMGLPVTCDVIDEDAVVFDLQYSTGDRHEQAGITLAELENHIANDDDFELLAAWINEHRAKIEAGQVPPEFDGGERIGYYCYVYPYLAKNYPKANEVAVAA